MRTSGRREHGTGIRVHGKRITLTQSGRNPFIFSPGTLRPRVTLRVIRGWSCRQPLRLPPPPPPNHRLCAPLVVPHIPHSPTVRLLQHTVTRNEFQFLRFPARISSNRSPIFFSKLSNDESLDRSIRVEIFARSRFLSSRSLDGRKSLLSIPNKNFRAKFYDGKIMARLNIRGER